MNCETGRGPGRIGADGRSLLRGREDSFIKWLKWGRVVPIERRVVVPSGYDVRCVSFRYSTADNEIGCMGARLSKVRELAGMAFMAALAMVAMAATAEPYLPALGPVPLRFVVKSPPPVADVASATAPAVTESSITVSVSASAGSSNAIPAVAAAEVLPAAATNGSATLAEVEVPKVESPLAEVSASAKTPPVFQAPESYDFIPALPGMTPQALAEYFQPVPNRTNASGAAVALPLTASFIPPVPQTQLSSRATYKIQ